MDENNRCPDCGDETDAPGCRCEDCIDDEIATDDAYCETCHNTGEVDCYCGGDLCVCLNGPTLPCPDCAR